MLTEIKYHLLSLFGIIRKNNVGGNMELFLGLLSMLFGSLFMSLTVDTLGTTGNSFLMIYGLGLFVLGGLVLGSRKTKRVKKLLAPICKE